MQQRFTSFSAILNPTAFEIAQVEASNMIHTEWNASASAVIKSRKDEAAKARSSAKAHWAGCKKSRSSRFLGTTDSWSHLKIGSKGHRKQEAARKTALPHAPGHQEFSSGHSCKYHMCGAVAVDPSQETANDLKQLRSLDLMEDPGVIDAWIRGGKLSQ